MVKSRLISSLKENNFKTEEIQKLTGDASTRVYYRVFLRKNTLSTLIAMVLPEKIEVNEKGNTDFITEEPFINLQRYLIKSNLNIPEIYVNDEKNRVILLEDLGDTRFYDEAQKTSTNIKSLYKKAIKELIEFQKYTFENKDENIYAFKRNFDKSTLYWELEHFIEWRVNEALGIKLSDKNTFKIKQYFDKITENLLKLPQITVHRDFQSKNIMIKNKKYYIIDFQDALQGSYVYDLVALLKDSYIELDEDFVKEMLKYYISETENSRKIKYDFQTLYKDFKEQTLQRKLKDIGRFHYIDLFRNNPSFLQYIPLSIKYVKLYLEELYPELYEILKDTLNNKNPI